MRPIIYSLYLLAVGAIWQPAAALETDSKQPIYIESNSAIFDDSKGEGSYDGNVQVTQGSIRINADRMLVYTTNRKIDKVVALGNPVRFEQSPGENKEHIHGHSLRAEYYVAESRLVLLQEAVVHQGSNTYASDRIEYNSNTSIVQAGQKTSDKQRVHVTLQPNNK